MNTAGEEKGAPQKREGHREGTDDAARKGSSAAKIGSGAARETEERREGRGTPQKEGTAPRGKQRNAAKIGSGAARKTEERCDVRGTPQRKRNATRGETSATRKRNVARGDERCKGRGYE